MNSLLKCYSELQQVEQAAHEQVQKRAPNLKWNPDLLNIITIEEHLALRVKNELEQNPKGSNEDSDAEVDSERESEQEDQAAEDEEDAPLNLELKTGSLDASENDECKKGESEVAEDDQKTSAASQNRRIKNYFRVSKGSKRCDIKLQNASQH